MIYYCRWHVVFLLFLLSVNWFSFDCFFSNSDDSFSLFRFGIFFLTRMTYFRCAIWIWFRSKAKITRKEQTKPTYCVQICKYKRNHPNYDGLLRWFGYICFTIGRLFINLKWETKKKTQFQVFVEFQRRPTTDLSLTHSLFCRHAVSLGKRVS